jgi:enoyl-CoA hydratase/carnithine racemase
MDDVLEFAESLAKRPPLAVAAVLKAVSAGEYEGIDKGLDVEDEGTAIVSTSKDCIEGFTAFFEKRDPNFQGE